MLAPTQLQRCSTTMNLLSAFCQQLNSPSRFLCSMNAIAATVDDAQSWPQYICQIYSALHHSLPPSHPCFTSAEPTSPHMPAAKEFAFPQANLCVSACNCVLLMQLRKLRRQPLMQAQRASKAAATSYWRPWYASDQPAVLLE